MSNTVTAAQGRRNKRVWIADADKYPDTGGFWYAASIPKEKHGTFSTYNNWFCRCDRCKNANRLKTKKYWTAGGNGRSSITIIANKRESSIQEVPR